VRVFGTRCPPQHRLLLLLLLLRLRQGKAFLSLQAALLQVRLGDELEQNGDVHGASRQHDFMGRRYTSTTPLFRAQHRLLSQQGVPEELYQAKALKIYMSAKAGMLLHRLLPCHHLRALC
jgi:hypothetical protein